MPLTLVDFILAKVKSKGLPFFHLSSFITISIVPVLHLNCLETCGHHWWDNNFVLWSNYHLTSKEHQSFVTSLN